MVSVATEEGDRQRPARNVNVTVVTDDGAFDGSGSETTGITVDLSAGSAR